MQRLQQFVPPVLIVVLIVLVVWWGTRLLPGTTIPIPPVATTDASAGDGRLDAVLASARLFGSRRPGVLSDNVRALGVIADASGRGSVIVSVDGQAPKVYRVGDTLDGRLVSAIRAEEIDLEAGGARQTFRLPPARAAAPGLTTFGTTPPVVDAPPTAIPADATAPPAGPGQLPFRTNMPRPPQPTGQ